MISSGSWLVVQEEKGVMIIKVFVQVQIISCVQADILALEGDSKQSMDWTGG